MKKTVLQSSDLKNKAFFKMFAVVLFSALFLSGGLFAGFWKTIAGSNAHNQSQTLFRIGEKLTYSISYDRYKNAGYAETFVVSEGKLNDKMAIELSSKLKTNEFVSAAFYFLDESRSVFASRETGLPLYIRKTSNLNIFPEEKVDDFQTAPTSGFDLLTMIYRLRQAGGNGNFSLLENDKIYNLSAQTANSEKVQTDAGDFDTTISIIQSEYFSEKGFSDLRINFSSDEYKIPVLIRFKAGKGEFRASLASVQIIEDEAPVPSVTPILTPTPLASATPTVKSTPKPYLENQPLPAEMPFLLGETLEFKINAAGQPVGIILLQAKERKEIVINSVKQDTLLLAATVINVEKGIDIFKINDSIIANVEPENLQAQQLEIKFKGSLSGLNQLIKFDQNRGIAFLDGTAPVQIPVNTHNILSLFYAIRSFNLKPSKEITNPVNDTRVAVFYGNQYYVFMLRPSSSQLLTLQGEKIPAQLITIITGNPALDALNLRLWLSNDNRRTPLRFTIGNYQADLVSEKILKP